MVEKGRYKMLGFWVEKQAKVAETLYIVAKKCRNTTYSFLLYIVYLFLSAVRYIVDTYIDPRYSVVLYISILYIG